MRSIQARFAALVALTLLLGASASAQNMPDAGALMRQSEQMFKQSQVQRMQPQRASLPPELVVNDATVVTAQRFKFNGNQLLTTGQLQATVLPFTNRPLNQHDLQQLTYSVSEAYRQVGWVVQVYIPRQDLSSSELTVQVIESIPPSKPLH
jgi:hemolysin activation/secretion protein